MLTLLAPGLYTDMYVGLLMLSCDRAETSKRTITLGYNHMQQQPC
jgi:hypothetical protein